MGVPVVEEGALAEKSDPEDQESVGNESEAASEDEDQQDEEESDSDSYSIDGTEDEHLEKLLLFYTDVPPKSVEEEEEEEEEDDEEEADRESDNGGYDEVEPDTESEADASSCGDDEVSGTPTEEAPDSSESDQSQPETVCIRFYGIFFETELHPLGYGRRGRSGMGNCFGLYPRSPV